MKRIILISLILAASLSAKEADKLRFTNAPIYMDYSFGYVLTESGDLGLDEPMANIVGGDSLRHELEVGKHWKANEHVYRMFLYGWLSGEEKNHEHGLGVGLKWQVPKFKSVPLRLMISAKAGLGEQNVKGKEFKTETNSNPLNYVFSGMGAGHDLKRGDYSATFKEDTSVIEMGLGVGLVYDINKDLSFATEYTYLHHYYSYVYHVEGNTMGSALSGAVQSNHYFKASIAYKF